MDIWDGLQVYDLVNDGHGGYHFHNTSKGNDDRACHFSESVPFLFAALRKSREASRLAREEA